MKTSLLFKIFWKTVILFLACCHTCVISAQAIPADTAGSVAINNAINSYHQYLAPQTSLYNGPEYIDYNYTINEGIPFFEIYQFSNGAVEYNKVWYYDIPLLFDEVKGELIIKDYYGRGKIKLNTERVTAFNLLNHQFVQLRDSDTKSTIRPGFYDVLYQGNLAVYKRQTKEIIESVTVSLGVKRVISERNNYFIRKGPVFYPVKSKAAVLSVTKDRKKEVQQYIRKNKLNIRKGKELFFIKVITYYDQLTSN